MRRLLILGETGQVATALRRSADRAGFEPVAVGRATVDLSDVDASALLTHQRPDVVINAAAYTAVDRAESEVAMAMRLNCDLPSRIADACADAAVPLVHISTDYVFDGAKVSPYVESDPRNPLGVYGRSKAAGEEAVEAAGARSAIVRTAWVYGPDGANFLKTMLRLAGTQDELGVVDDQRGCPTRAQDVAEATLRLAHSLLSDSTAATGIFHAAGEGDASWADFAEMIFAESASRGGPSARVRRITTAEFPTPAARPANSRLGGNRLETAVGWRPGPWRDALPAVFDALV